MFNSLEFYHYVLVVVHSLYVFSSVFSLCRVKVAMIDVNAILT